jgi:hypothetical protein
VVVLVLRIVAVLDQGLALLGEAIGQALQEQQPQDVVLVVRRVDGPTQDVGGRPQVAFELLAGELARGRRGGGLLAVGRR